MDEKMKRKGRYDYICRQRGFSVCHQNTSSLHQVEANSKPQTKKLPSILIQNGDLENTEQNVCDPASYDCTYLNPSNTLDAAVAQNNSRLLEKLLTSAANISLEGQNASGGTPIHEAAYQGKASCLRVFLKFGADVNLRDREGWSPLHAAICGGELNSVSLLLKHGASINITTNDGISPIDMALQSEDEDITRAILLANEGNTEKEGIAPLASEEAFESELSL